MSVFIKVHSEEMRESKEALKKIKFKCLELSKDTKDFFENAEHYARNLKKTRDISTDLHEKVFKLRSLLPKVPKTILPVTKELEKKEIEKIKKRKSVKEELEKIREIIETL